MPELGRFFEVPINRTAATLKKWLNGYLLDDSYYQEETMQDAFLPVYQFDKMTLTEGQ